MTDIISCGSHWAGEDNSTIEDLIETLKAHPRLRLDRGGMPHNSIKFMKIIITHDGFHGTSTLALKVNGKPGEIVTLSETQVQKLGKACCGMRDCKCGESMIKALSDWQESPTPNHLIVPESGEIELRGNYPQNR